MSAASALRMPKPRGCREAETRRPDFRARQQSAGLDRRRRRSVFSRRNRPGDLESRRCRRAGRAEAARIATKIIPHKDFTSREAFDSALTEALRGAGVGLVCLAGFMRLLTAGFAEDWHDRLINIHPSLLPSFKGLNSHAGHWTPAFAFQAARSITSGLRWMPVRSFCRQRCRYMTATMKKLWRRVS